jgi:hypothetical protein
MADYNIIYIAKDHQHYLWNGSGFDFFDKKENEKLMFSGKTYEDKELTAALKKCREAVKIAFPVDTDPDLKPVKVLVNSKDESKGHAGHISS